MDNTYCLSVDDSKKMCESMQEDDLKKFKYAYFKSFSGALIIRKADLSDFTSPFDKKNMEFITYAIPKDFKPKRKAIVHEYSEEVTIIDRVDWIKQQYDYISEEAFMFECEAYKEEDFIDPKVCKEMWKLGVELQTITGWAFYALTSKEKVSKKNSVIPIKARPLLDKEFNSSVYNITFFSEAYLKRDFPEIADISLYSLRRMGENGIKRAVNTLVLKQNNFSCSKITRKSGKNTKVIFVYYEDDCFETMKQVEKLIGDDILDFQFESYMSDNSNRIVINKSESIRLLKELKIFKDKI